LLLLRALLLLHLLPLLLHLLLALLLLLLLALLLHLLLALLLLLLLLLARIGRRLLTLGRRALAQTLRRLLLRLTLLLLLTDRIATALVLRAAPLHFFHAALFCARRWRNGRFHRGRRRRCDGGRSNRWRC
jgi:hypothetical protein